MENLDFIPDLTLGGYVLFVIMILLGCFIPYKLWSYGILLYEKLKNKLGILKGALLTLQQT